MLLFAVMSALLINVLIAWVLPRFGPMRIVLNGHLSNMEPLDRSHPAVGVLADDSMLTGFSRQSFHGWGFDREVVYATDGVLNRSITRIRCGWPLRCLAGSDTTGIGLQDAIEAPDMPLLPRPRSFSGWAFLPTGVLWPGFVLNTMMYAAIIIAVFIVPGRVRRTIRRMRHRCPACAYPIGVSPRCSECGTVLECKART